MGHGVGVDRIAQGITVTGGGGGGGNTNSQTVNTNLAVGVTSIPFTVAYPKTVIITGSDGITLPLAWVENGSDIDITNPTLSIINNVSVLIVGG